MEKISRKSFVKGALGLGAVGILAGCASSASSTAASASSINLTLNSASRRFCSRTSPSKV